MTKKVIIVLFTCIPYAYLRFEQVTIFYYYNKLYFDLLIIYMNNIINTFFSF